MSLSFRQDLQSRNTIMVGNASDRPWHHMFSSQMYHWAPREVKPIGAMIGLPVDEWGQTIRETASQAKDANGNPVKNTAQLVTMAGGSTEEVVQNILDYPGSPCYPVLHDGGDGDRADRAEKNYLDYHLSEARKTVNSHRAMCQMNLTAGIPNGPMPQYVWESEQLLISHAKQAQSNLKRYLVILDGAGFEFRDDAQAHILHATRWPQYVDTWQSYVKDIVGGPHALRSNADLAVVGSGWISAAALGILELAKRSGVELPAELVSRLDSDPESVTEAMEIIYTAPKPKQGRKSAA
jgi:hypothetical protein